jgi:hypothetical protein
MGNESLLVGIVARNIKFYNPCACFGMECLYMHDLGRSAYVYKNLARIHVEFKG